MRAPRPGAARPTTTTVKEQTCMTDARTVREPGPPADGGAAHTIRPAEPGDLGAVLALVGGAGLPVAGIAAGFPGGFAVAVVREGGIVGVAGLEVRGEHGLLRSVAVHAAHRGRGLGAALTRDRVAAARGLGLDSVYALTETAASYFPRFGFSELDRAAVPAGIRGSLEFSEVCPATAVVLRLRLADAGSPGVAASVAGTAGGDLTADALADAVRARYGEAARRAASGAAASCGPSCCGNGGAGRNPITSDLYAISETGSLPGAAVLASLGCGNPTALAALYPGDVVLDLGSGGGIDVLLSARRVGPTGRVYGLDMTEEMLHLARENAARAGVRNVEFLEGRIERIPLPDASVDVIISNCVVNLSADKRRVLEESFRVLRPGGRFAISDIVVRGGLPAAARRALELWVGCIAGALEVAEFEELLREAGFTQIGIEPTRVYGVDEARAFLDGAGLDVDAIAAELDGRVMSAFVRAVKPG
jgi:arsenite methyltransferase